MERLLEILPDRPQPLPIRIGATTLIMMVCSALQLAVYAYAGFRAFFILLPGIAAAGVMFDRGSGFFATIIGTATAVYLTSIAADVRQIVPLALFIATGFITAFFSESLRKTLERLSAAERSKDVLLRELHHRTKNNMSIMAALLRAQARASGSEETKSALAAAARRIAVMGSIEDFLRPSSTDNTIGLSDYLEEYALKMEELRVDTAINISLKSDRVDVSERVALPVGIIINELVTNSLKHAFPNGRKGRIDIRVWKEGDLVVEVADDGVGCAQDAAPGVGSRLMEAMAKQLCGTITREPGNPGCLTRLRFPLST